MRRTRMWLLIAVVLALVVMVALPVAAGPGKGAYVGTYDNGGPYGTYFGDIDYVYNNAGYHLWFTVETSRYAYTAGHSYHNIYKYDLADTTGWCGPVAVRANPAGTTGFAWYKIWDVTTEMWVCGSD